MEELSIELPIDEEGFVLLQCNLCGEYFKMKAEDLEAEENINIWCPYCGLKSDNYIPEEVKEIAIRKAIHQMNNMIYNSFKDLERNTRNNKSCRIKSEKKPREEEIQLAKTNRGKSLPTKSGYKLRYAQNNNFKQQQLKLDLSEKTNKTTVEPYYGIITYNVNRNLDIESINLVIPATDMETYIEKIDIKSEVERLKTIQNDKQNEKTLVTLKNEFKRSQIINEK